MPHSRRSLLKASAAALALSALPALAAPPAASAPSSHEPSQNAMKTITLNDGHTIPTVGFGVFMIPNDGPTYEAVKAALKAGYRHIDTAAAYRNESDVGKAVRDSGIPRGEIFITSKLWLQDYGYEAAKKGIATSLEKLGTDYIDLYLLHQPYGDVPGAWRALEEAKAEGKIRSIGVSNMTPKFWREFVPQFKTVPAVNQVEFNPFFQQKELRKILDAAGVKLQAWYPLGHGNKELLEHPAITALAKKYGKNAGQIILRFEVQDGVITLPKSSNPERIAGNIDIFDFALTDE
ncbi:MAG: aldo/keto reductase, partial [Ottowia sp.]|nr:aldo/keto reductase [Ottowia sp.]